MTCHVGIAYGHTATVAVVQDSKLVFCQSEERLSRIKGSAGFPHRTLRYVLDGICSPGEVDTVTLFQESMTGFVHLHNTEFKDHEIGSYLTPADLVRLSDIEPYLTNRELVERWRAADRDYFAELDASPDLNAASLEYFRQATGAEPARIRRVNHHDAHALSCVPFLFPKRSPTLIFTLDAEGDGLCATVSIFENGHLRRIAEVPRVSSIGHVYMTVTGLLGMRQGEHEYKVMGLSAYAKRDSFAPLLARFRELLWVDDDGSWKNSYGIPAVRNYLLQEAVKLKRFDQVAGALQAFAEEMITKWIQAWVRKTGVGDVACAGGVFMNVKVNKEVAQLADVTSLVVTPSCGDESTAIGAAVHGSLSASPELQPVRGLDLGRAWTDQEAEDAFGAANVTARYEIRRPENINHAVATLLAAGEVVARCSGRMEFGARALGNRSILADPRSERMIGFINDAVKNRDFWMPFAPSILAEATREYLVNPKNIDSPFMMLAYDSTQRGRRDLPAAMHRQDFTMRAQLVSREGSPEYHDLISRFGALTGVRGVLNTSLNIHGEPIVGSPADAIRTMDSSGLRHAAIGSFLLTKRV